MVGTKGAVLYLKCLFFWIWRCMLSDWIMFGSHLAKLCVCVCVEFRVSLSLDNRFFGWMVFYITTNLNQRDGWIGISYQGCPCRHMNTYDLYILYRFIICSYIFSTQHLLLQYLLQYFSKMSKNLAGHSRAGTLMGAFQLKGRAGEPTWRPKIAIFERRDIFQIIILCIYPNILEVYADKSQFGIADLGLHNSQIPTI